MNKISNKIYEIISAKNSAGRDAYLFLDLDGQLYLWRPAGEGRVIDVGRKILAQWKLSPSEITQIWWMPSLTIEKASNKTCADVFSSRIVANS